MPSTATQQYDFFELFSLGLNQGWDEQSFLWSDMLHYRKTGQYGQALWSAATKAKAPGGGPDEALLAYALGYLTHVATDVTGHPLVNSIAGGPFRLHWQRHHLVENHIDALWCLHDPLRLGGAGRYGQLTESALHYDIAFGPGNRPVARPPYPEGGSLRERYVRRRLLTINDSELPDAVAEMLIKAMEDTYYVGGGAHPKIMRDDDGKPNVELIKKTYKLLSLYLKTTTTDGFSHERPDPPDVFPNLDFPVFDDPGSSSAPGDDDDDSSFWDDVLDFLLSLAKAIIYIVQVALWLASLPFGILTDITTYPLRLGIYYALELPLFHLFKTVRLGLVMTGYLAPMDDEIATGLTRVGFPDPASFADTKRRMDDVFGGVDQDLGDAAEAPTTWRDPLYPHLTPPDEWRSPWLYPTTPPEQPGSNIRAGRPITASPHGQGADVDALFRTVLGDPNLRDAFEAARRPADADAAGLAVTPDRHLGDAVSFGEHLIWLATRSAGRKGSPRMVDWNLDADRGYGYHCWDWTRDPNRTGQDPGGQTYPLPCVPPSQAAGFEEKEPVLLHFEEDPDPGCAKGLTVMLEPSDDDR